MPIICSSVNRERFIRPSPSIDGLYQNLEEIQGLRSDVLNAYEELLTEKNGRTTKASRTRQKLKNKGVEQCLIDWSVGEATDGFRLLIERGIPELTAEYLVVKHDDRFPEEVVQAARNRLADHGVDVPG